MPRQSPSSPTVAIDTANRTHARIDTAANKPTASQDAVVVEIDNSFHKVLTLNDFDQFLGCLQSAGKQAHEAFEERQRRG